VNISKTVTDTGAKVTISD